MRRILFCLLWLAAAPALAAPCAGFNDVDSNDPFCPSVQWIKARSITLGCTANLYCPNDGVSRLQMAAFMMRLGEALVPPNVLVVAPVKGTYQSIQAAINHAATIATPTTPVVVRVAPGTYAEAITLAPNVEVEGTSTTATLLSPPPGALGCANPSTAAVVMAPDSRLRHIAIHGCAHGIYMNGGSQLPGISFAGTKIQDVNITGSTSTGIRTAGLVRDVGAIERVRIEMDITSNVGIHVEGAAFSLADVTIFASTIGIKTLGGAHGTFERVSISAVGPYGPGFGIDAMDFSKVAMRDSTVGTLGTAIRTTALSTVSAANTALSGVNVGPGVTCFSVYQIGTLVPLTC